MVLLWGKNLIFVGEVYGGGKVVAAESVGGNSSLDPLTTSPSDLTVGTERFLRSESLYSGRGAARLSAPIHGVNTWWNIDSRNLALLETAKLRHRVFDNKSDVCTIIISFLSL